MFHNGAEHFNSIAAGPDAKSDQIIKIVNPSGGEMIVDVGSGGGYYSLIFAEMVGPRGKIYALDVNTEFLDYINDQAALANIHNVVTVPVQGHTFPFSPQSVDKVFLRNVTHHMKQRKTFFKQVAAALKHDGTIYIIDYSPAGNRVGYGPPGHFVEPRELEEELDEAGLLRKATHEFIQGQLFYEYGRDQNYTSF